MSVFMNFVIEDESGKKTALAVAIGAVIFCVDFVRKQQEKAKEETVSKARASVSLAKDLHRLKEAVRVLSIEIENFKKQQQPATE